MDLREGPNSNGPSQHFGPKDRLLASQQTFPNRRRPPLMRDHNCPGSDPKGFIFWMEARPIREGLDNLFNFNLVHRRKWNRITGRLKRSRLVNFRPKSKLQGRCRQTLQRYRCIPSYPQIFKVRTLQNTVPSCILPSAEGARQWALLVMRARLRCEGNPSRLGTQQSTRWWIKMTPMPQTHRVNRSQILQSLAMRNIFCNFFKPTGLQQVHNMVQSGKDQVEPPARAVLKCQGGVRVPPQRSQSAEQPSSDATVAWPIASEHLENDSTPLRTEELGLLPDQTNPIDQHLKLWVQRGASQHITNQPRRPAGLVNSVKIARMTLTIKLDGNWSSF